MDLNMLSHAVRDPRREFTVNCIEDENCTIIFTPCVGIKRSEILVI